MNKWKLPVIILCSFMCGLSISAFSGEDDERVTSPIRLEALKTPYSEMATDFPLWPKENIISGVSEHRYKTFYSNDITVEIYEAKPLTLRIKDFPIDEFVTVVSGKLILTTEGGKPQHFEVGDSVLVPKGFTGTWEMQGKYRELIAYKTELSN